HLHFAVKKNGVFVDSETLKLDSLQVLPIDERMEFVGARSKLDSLLDAITLPPALEEKSPSPSPEPSQEAPSDDIGLDTVPSAAPAEASPSPAQPSPAQAPVPNAPVPPPGVPGGRSIYLSDQELLRSQPSSDDGEVER